MTFAPAGTARLAPTASMVSPLIRIVWPLSARPVTVSMSVPALMTVTAGSCARSGATAKTSVATATSAAVRMVVRTGTSWSGGSGQEAAGASRPLTPDRRRAQG